MRDHLPLSSISMEIERASLSCPGVRLHILLIIPGKHGDHPINQIDACPLSLKLLLSMGAPFLNIMAHIRYMDTKQEVPAGQAFHGDSIIQVLCICSVYCYNALFSQIDPIIQVSSLNGFTDG